MMARPKVKLNSRGIAEVLRSEGVRRELREHAERVAARARAQAPVDTGAYRDSIRVESDTTDRAVERVVSDDPAARIIEARTGNLARALGAEGG